MGHETLKRFLESIAATPREIDAMPLADLIRSGNEAGLALHDWPRWRQYRDMRSKTSHTHDERVAREVVAGIPKFLEEIRFLLGNLEKRLQT